MKELTPADFTTLIGSQFTIDNPHDDLPPHTLTLQAVETLFETDDERRNAFALVFIGPPMIGTDGQSVSQGLYTFQGGLLDGHDVFVSVNGYAQGTIELYEYEAVFG